MVARLLPDASSLNYVRPYKKAPIKRPQKKADSKPSPPGAMQPNNTSAKTLPPGASTTSSNPSISPERPACPSKPIPPSSPTKEASTCASVRNEQGRKRKQPPAGWGWAEAVTARDCAWLQRDLRDLRQLGLLLLPLGGFDSVEEPAWQHLRRHLFRCDQHLPSNEPFLKKPSPALKKKNAGSCPAWSMPYAISSKHGKPSLPS